jgi:ribosomal protein L23
MQARFRTAVDVGKLEIREFLEKVYNLPVVKVDTAIIYGRKKSVATNPKNTKRVLSKRPDYKKVWVQFAPGRLWPGDGTVALENNPIARNA